MSIDWKKRGEQPVDYRWFGEYSLSQVTTACLNYFTTNLGGIWAFEVRHERYIERGSCTDDEHSWGTIDAHFDGHYVNDTFHFKTLADCQFCRGTLHQKHKLPRLLALKLTSEYYSELKHD
jgi:hypothetical protein